MASLGQEMSREQKELMITQKMEMMQKRDEELNKRYKEIEEDKQNAAKLSSTVVMEDVKPYVMKVPRPRPEKPEPLNNDEGDGQLQSPRANNDFMLARQRLSETDGPPPDPSFRFLADPDRDGFPEKSRSDNRGKRGRGRGGKRSVSGEEGDQKTEENEDELVEEFPSNDRGFSRGRGRGGRGRGRGGRGNEEVDEVFEDGHNGRGRRRGNGDKFGGRGGRGNYNSENDGFSRGGGRGRGNYNNFENDDGFSRGGRGKQRGRGGGRGENRGRGDRRGGGRGREYDRWKAEREAIDEARLNRAKTTDGEWRREWDSAKIEQGEADESPIYDARYPPRKEDSLKLGEFLSNSLKTQPAPAKEHDHTQHDWRSNDVPYDSGDSSFRGRGRTGGRSRSFRGNKGGRGRGDRRPHFEREDNARRHEEEIMSQLNPDNVFGDRKIINKGETLQVSVPVPSSDL